ncbi:MAG: sulfite exporter TauE/SafE family protein [Candidatus Accumulibacter sp.]|jgi:uncharacterized membrane protein YfcA|nr:sulfite exporter TauE/SafE family protein [Accumulibacter sp.]
MSNLPFFPDLILFVAGALVAAFVQGLSGFAFGLTAMSFWIWGLDPKFAAVMVVAGSIVGQVITLFSLRLHFSPKLLMPYLVGGLIGIPLGVYVLPWLNPDHFKLMLGGLLVIWSPVMFFSPHLPPVKSGGRFGDALAGTIGGFMGGVGGFTGVIPTLWCTLRKLEKSQQRIIIQNFNLTTLSVTMAAYIATGTVTSDMAPLLLILVVAVLIPSLLGARIYLSLNQETFRRLVLVLLGFSGLTMLFVSISRLMGERFL